MQVDTCTSLRSATVQVDDAIAQTNRRRRADAVCRETVGQSPPPKFVCVLFVAPVCLYFVGKKTNHYTSVLVLMYTE